MLGRGRGGGPSRARVKGVARPRVSGARKGTQAFMATSIHANRSLLVHGALPNAFGIRPGGVIPVKCKSAGYPALGTDQNPSGAVSGVRPPQSDRTRSSPQSGGSQGVLVGGHSYGWCGITKGIPLGGRDKRHRHCVPGWAFRPFPRTREGRESCAQRPTKKPFPTLRGLSALSYTERARRPGSSARAPHILHPQGGQFRGKTLKTFCADVPQSGTPR